MRCITAACCVWFAARPASESTGCTSTILARLDARERRRRLDALVDVVVNVYAPLPAASLSYAVRRLRYAVPQWSSELTGALQRARHRLAHARVDGVDWYWPAGEQPGVAEPDDTVRLLAPFDPVVWDRRRFELLWNWAYRFEAYTPVPKRRWGYYALPLLWRDGVIGWANASVAGRRLDHRCRLRRREAATRSSIPSGTRRRARSLGRVSRPRRLTRPDVGAIVPGRIQQPWAGTDAHVVSGFSRTLVPGPAEGGRVRYVRYSSSLPGHQCRRGCRRLPVVRRLLVGISQLDHHGLTVRAAKKVIPTGNPSGVNPAGTVIVAIGPRNVLR